MNKPCQAIATAKHSPMYFRFRINQAENDPGNKPWTGEIAAIRKINGMANRTEKPIIVDTPEPDDMSTPDALTIMTSDIGTETSQNNRQPLIALFFGAGLELLSINFS